MIILTGGQKRSQGQLILMPYLAFSTSSIMPDYSRKSDRPTANNNPGEKKVPKKKTAAEKAVALRKEKEKLKKRLKEIDQELAEK